MELYIHIPFCVRKCNYCDFLSFPCGSGIDSNTCMAKDGCYSISDYVDALCAELDSLAQKYNTAHFDTAFIGGGTPSILPAALMEKVLKAADRLMGGAPDEYTIECNPGTVDEEKLNLYRRYGINRVSFGLQSVNDDELKMLGRIHNYSQFLESFRLAREAGFDNINIDLISAIPGQTVKSWEATVRTVAKLKPEHISAYSLIIEPGTKFWDLYGEESGDLPDEDSEREMYKLTARVLAEYGFTRYEISNYATPGRESKHNLGYWTGEEYLGAGLGASSYVSVSDDVIKNCEGLSDSDEPLVTVRYKNTDDMGNYLKTGQNGGAQKHCEEEYLNRTDMMSEYMFLHLRLVEGLEIDDFKRKFGIGVFEKYGDIINKYIETGFMRKTDSRVMLTEQGLDVSNVIMAEFV